MFLHYQNRGVIIKTYFRIYQRFKEWFCHPVQIFAKRVALSKRKKGIVITTSYLECKMTYSFIVAY